MRWSVPVFFNAFFAAHRFLLYPKTMRPILIIKRLFEPRWPKPPPAEARLSASTPQSSPRFIINWYETHRQKVNN